MQNIVMCMVEAYLSGVGHSLALEADALSTGLDALSYFGNFAAEYFKRPAAMLFILGAVRRGK